MRVLSTVTGSQGHARAVLPMVRALAKAGHEVLVCLPPHLAEVYADSGARVEPALPDFIAAMQEMRQLRDNLDPALLGPGGEVDERAQLIGFAGGPQVASAYRAVLPLAEEFRPDIVLRDGGELAGCLIAEKLGIPHISAPSGAGNLIDPEGLHALLNERRAELGLPCQDDKFSIYRYGRIDCMPAGYTFNAFDSVEPFRYSQPMLSDGSAGLPAEFAGLSGDKPLVLASVGTSLPVVMGMQMMGIEMPDGMMDPVDTLRAIVGGLSLLDCHAIVSTGGLPVEGLEAGPNVHVVDWVPQPLLLQCAQVFLTHAGYNGIREGVRAGVPMATLPQYADEPHNAERITELGLGAPILDVTPEGIAAVCERLLTDEKITANVRSAHRQMLGLPGIDAVVAHLESLAAEHTAPAAS
ncbi:glycosyltransferase [Streptomyces sp. ISL-94]|uniref:glycosyltransferase n=1 Tax=Streptomyces sp. ISL-94 TaxID=2819190 RepID=UPI001BEC12D4|nr:glycosyltransferase [Streptomyces sp. ISL-94]MBT2481863.1 glycosyltransferase family 1 protein [Streptomyces sp. ISL-94]